jgi:hypothetical protein
VSHASLKGYGRLPHAHVNHFFILIIFYVFLKDLITFDQLDNNNKKSVEKTKNLLKKSSPTLKAI